MFRKFETPKSDKALPCTKRSVHWWGDFYNLILVADTIGYVLGIPYFPELAHRRGVDLKIPNSRQGLMTFGQGNGQFEASKTQSSGQPRSSVLLFCPGAIAQLAVVEWDAHDAHAAQCRAYDFPTDAEPSCQPGWRERSSSFFPHVSCRRPDHTSQAPRTHSQRSHQQRLRVGPEQPPRRPSTVDRPPTGPCNLY
ncbi:hypothetical protein DFH07DRAFT_798730 [Mycena maculata]|uniref:Uncharacterized protein n=1 Tax=Mycena maculata TaxID=230809 RepID=A0AAD7NVD6_9AGAR|nr:hypothetical protein DFH07DRAFT_798730 [Mycena maculata]